MSTRVLVSLLAVILALCASRHETAQAQEEEIEEAPSLLEGTPAAALGVPPWLTIILRQDAEAWGNPYGGFRQRAVYTGLLSFGVEVDLGYEGWWPGASFGAVGYWTQGEDLSAVATGDASVVSNIASFPTVQLAQAWYHQTFAEETFAFRVGVIALDDDFMVLDTAALFINSSLGAMPTQSFNIPTPIYPYGSLGAHFSINASDDWRIQLGVYDGDAGGEETNPHGVEIALDEAGATLVAEVRWGRGEGVIAEVSLGGLAQLGQVFDFEDQETVFALGMVYAQIEVALWPLGDGWLWSFIRGSYAAPSTRVGAEGYGDIGVVVDGHVWSRPGDRLGLAATGTFFAAPYREAAQRLDGVSLTASEWLIELTYRAELLPWIWLQPTAQWFFSPHFSREDTLALAARLSVMF